MTLQELLQSLTDSERDFIAQLDYGQAPGTHRKALDAVIANGGVVDCDRHGVWFPLEVIELGANELHPGHKRAYAACVGLVLMNGFVGDEAERIVDHQMEAIEALPADLRGLIEELILEAIAQDWLRTGQSSE